MKCTFCGLEFNENEATRACAHCPLHRACGLVRCPRCGFEAPPEPEWAKRMKSRKEEKHETQ